MPNARTFTLISEEFANLPAQKKHIRAYPISNVIPMDMPAFRDAVDAAKAQGYTAIRLHLAWYNVEKLPLRYDFRLYDAEVAYIRHVGMKVILQIDLSRRSHVMDGVRIPCDLVLNTDEFAYRAGEDDAAYFTGTGVETVMLSFASRKGTDYATRFYRDTVKHFADRFGATVICAYPSLSPDGTTDYPADATEDASAHMRRAYAAYLKKTYRKIKELNRDLDAHYKDFDEVPLPGEDCADLRCVLYYQARHTVLDAFIERLCEAHAGVTKKFPFATLPGAERGEEELHAAIMEVIGARSVEGKKQARKKEKMPLDPTSPEAIFRAKAKAAAKATAAVASGIILITTAIAAQILLGDDSSE